MRKILSLIIIFISSLSSVYALDADPIAQTKALLDQYSTRVKYLEWENVILREEMRKAGIKIPLSAFSGILTTTPTSTAYLTPAPIATGVTTTDTKVVPTNTPTPPTTLSGEAVYANISKTYGASYAGFIRRVTTDWDKVRDAYLMPKNARIWGYEFVQSGSLDHVFVDIVYTGASGTGIYDAKILYQFDKMTFARKLIGFFEYNATTGYYTTKTGKNIFPGVKRVFVADPRMSTAITPPTAGSSTGVTVVTPPPTGVSSVTYADIEAAYTAKRYLTTISLSNNWLSANTPTLDVLRIRYRTYFIIAKYNEALTEIDRIKSIGQLSSAVACEGYVIATYAKNTTVADGYKAICNKK